MILEIDLSLIQQTFPQQKYQKGIDVNVSYPINWSQRFGHHLSHVIAGLIGRGALNSIIQSWLQLLDAFENGCRVSLVLQLSCLLDRESNQSWNRGVDTEVIQSSLSLEIKSWYLYEIDAAEGKILKANHDLWMPL